MCEKTLATKKTLTPKSRDISAWYNDLVVQAELADYGPVKGSMIIRPYGFAIWQLIQKQLDAMFKEDGVENAYFPTMIPLDFLHKEKRHIEGFSPELWVVTHAGGEKLDKPVAVRPTSETIMYDAYSRWISSWRDLPIKINQWNNVFRAEKRTYLFLRTSEFLWQEGHTAHSSFEEAEDMTLRALDWYIKEYETNLAIPVVAGIKSDMEKFAGAHHTYGVETLMPDGKALQSATSHHLSDNFAKVFDIKYQDKTGKLRYVEQTSWGLSTRSIGALILLHGDDDGLVIPPKLAPVQIVIIPISNSPQIEKFIADLAPKLDQNRIKIDSSDNTPGWKFNQWELKGAPLRLEIGDKEVAENVVTIANRLTRQKQVVQVADLPRFVNRELDSFQNELFARAKQSVKSRTYTPASYDEFKQIMAEKRGYLEAFWCEDPSCESSIKTETKASTRVLPLEEKAKKGSPAKSKGKCIYCGKPAKNRWLFAQSY